MSDNTQDGAPGANRHAGLRMNAVVAATTWFYGSSTTSCGRSPSNVTLAKCMDSFAGEAGDHRFGAARTTEGYLK